MSKDFSLENNHLNATGVNVGKQTKNQTHKQTNTTVIMSWSQETSTHGYIEK